MDQLERSSSEGGRRPGVQRGYGRRLFLFNLEAVAMIVFDGRKTVTTAGTRVALEALSSGIYCKELTVIAEEDNTGDIGVGADTVVAALATRRGILLAPGESYTFDSGMLGDRGALDLATVFIDSEIDTDGVHFGGLKNIGRVIGLPG